MKVGDKVLISPDLTLQKKWLAGTVIQVENNPFVGIVISAETEDRNVFFGREDLFKLAKEWQRRKYVCHKFRYDGFEPRRALWYAL